jgi:hypothetical protein
MHFGDMNKPNSIFSGTGTNFERKNSIAADNSEFKKKRFVGTNNGMVCEVERIEKLRSMMQLM